MKTPSRPNPRVGHRVSTGSLGAPPSEPWIADGVALGITFLLVVLILAGSTGVVRQLLALAFVCYVPGRAVVANWPPADLRAQVALAVVLSISIVSLVSVAGLWLHAWRPMEQFAAEASGSILAIAIAMVRRSPFAHARLVRFATTHRRRR
jgi:uncharacterized membrane protein